MNMKKSFIGILAATITIEESNYSAISGSVSIQLRFKANTKYFILTFPKSVAVLMNCHKDSILTALCS